MRGSLWIKLGSVLLAVVVWFSVITKVQSSVTIEAPVALRNIPEGLEPLDAPQHVAISISGPERLVKNLDSSGIGVSLDMTKARKGRHIYNIDERAVTLPAFMRLMDINPRSVAIAFEEKAKKTVPVRVSVTGVPLKGFSVRSVEVSPKESAIEGAASRVENISFLKAGPVDITNAVDTITTETIIAPEEGIRLEVDKVIVTVTIKGKAR